MLINTVKSDVSILAHFVFPASVVNKHELVKKNFNVDPTRSIFLYNTVTLARGLFLIYWSIRNY